MRAKRLSFAANLIGKSLTENQTVPLHSFRSVRRQSNRKTLPHAD